MSWDHYIAVRRSNLYEYGGTRKSLLALIASLIIGPSEEGQEPDPDEGWCVAKQSVLAAMMGMSPEEVCRQIGEFVADGWLTMVAWHDDKGHRHCKYTMTGEQLTKVVDRRMAKDEDGDYIRAEMPSKRRGARSQSNLRGAKPFDNLSNGPFDKASKSDVDLPSCVAKPSSPKNPSLPPPSAESQPQEDSLRSQKGMKGKPKTPLTSCTPQESEKVPPRRPAPAPAPAIVSQNPSPLKSEVEAKLRAVGAPPELFTALNGYTQIVTILNGDTVGGCSNPATAYATFARNNPKFAKIFMPVFNAQGFIDADFAEDAVSREAIRAMNANMTDAEREMERAQWWWGRLQIPERQPFNVPFKEKGNMTIYDNKGILEAYRGVQAAKGVVKRNESDGARAVAPPTQGYDAIDDI
jgi:hypothetical protein